MAPPKADEDEDSLDEAMDSNDNDNDNNSVVKEVEEKKDTDDDDDEVETDNDVNVENKDSEDVEISLEDTSPSVVLKSLGGSTKYEEENTAATDSNEKGVSFHDNVQVSMISMPESETAKEDVSGPMMTAEHPSPYTAIVEDSGISMMHLHREGQGRSFRARRNMIDSQIVRRLHRVDIETGNKSWREMHATPRWDFKDPMDPVERRLLMAKAVAKNTSEEDVGDNEDDDVTVDDTPQFSLSTKICERHFAHKENAWVKQYLHWTFRASFTSIIITDFLVFGWICLVWACCIYVGSLVNPRCFVVAGTPLNNFTDWRENFYFMDAFQLSWTTFSTVGYGIVYPQVNKGAIDARPDCFVFSFMVTLESFVGVLFAAFCGSIIFGKIARIQSIASIQWSDPMVIRYGMGVVDPKSSKSMGAAKTTYLYNTSNNDDDDDDSDSDSDSDDDEEDDKNTATKPETTDATMDASGTSLNLDSISKGSSGKKSNPNKVVKFPCPVMEFRVINSLHTQKGGEIMNACLHVYASTEASKSMESLEIGESQSNTAARLMKMSLELGQKTGRALQKAKDSVSHAKHLTGSALHRSTAASKGMRGSIVQRVNRAIVKPSASMPSTLSQLTEDSEVTMEEPEPFNHAKAVEAAVEQEMERQLAMASLAYAASSTKHIAVDDGSRGLVPRRIFSKMEIETDTHPFFKRVWNIRHTLNEESPLLSAKAKRIIHKHHGKWPQDICNPSFIRKNIHFHQVIVSLSGTHNCSGSDVYGMHVYEFNSVNIGYRFAQMLDVNDKGKLYLDVELLNDVREQRGGGGEAIRGFLVDEFGGTLHDDDGDIVVPAEASEGDMSVPSKIM